MMKKFKHVSKPREATEDKYGNYKLWEIDKENPRIKRSDWTHVDYSQEWKVIERHTIIPKELIEWCSDRIEIVEKDWIDCLYDSYQYKFWMPTDKDIFREYAEKHAPKKKKFTKDEVIKWKLKNTEFDMSNERYTLVICRFLKTYNLLSNTE